MKSSWWVDHDLVNIYAIVFYIYVYIYIYVIIYIYTCMDIMYVFIYIYISSVNITDMVNFRSPHLFCIVFIYPKLTDSPDPRRKSVFELDRRSTSGIFPRCWGICSFFKYPFLAQLQFSCQFLGIHQKDASQTCGFLFNFCLKTLEHVPSLKLTEPLKKNWQGLNGKFIFQPLIFSWANC